MVRVAGKTGRLPVKPVGERYAIGWLHDYITVPAPTYPVDVSKGITLWGMLGNDQQGDCVFAALAHDRMLAGAQPTTEQVLAEYALYDHGQDIGANIADYLLWKFQRGDIEAFVPVHPSNVDGVMAELGRGIMLSANLTDDAQQLFQNDQAWTVANGETPDPNEGHCVLKVGSTGPMSQAAYGTCVTWGANQRMENAWQNACVDEAWAIVTKDDMGDQAFAALLTDLRRLPDVHIVPPPTPPKPAPSPAPAPGAASFPGALPEIDAEIVAKATRAGVSVPAYQNAVWSRLFHLNDALEI
jgi:hypothetical protein